MMNKYLGLGCCLMAGTAHAVVTELPDIQTTVQTVVTGGPTVFSQSGLDYFFNVRPTGANTYFTVNPDGMNSLGVLLSSEPSATDVTLRGLNGFVISGSTSTSTTGRYSIFDTTNPAQNITGYNQFLFLVGSGAFLTRWETSGGATVSGPGRALWIAGGATVGAVSNTTTTLSDTIAFTTDGIISGTFTNTGTVRAGKVALDIEDNGSLGAIDNQGLLSGGLYAVRNTGTVGSLMNTGTVTGGILNAGTISGDVSLGGAALILAGNRAVLGGTVSGKTGDGSIVSVGDVNNSAAFTATNNVSVDNITVTSGSSLTLTPSAHWSAANGTVNNGTLTLESGSILDGPLSQNGTLFFSTEKMASSTINASLTNRGSLVLNPTPASAGNTLTVNGDYSGLPGSSVSLGSVLAGDNSLTDRLVVTGNTSGASTLFVTNENGGGAQTLDGIQLIRVGGRSDAVFALGNRVVAGSYDYSLRKGNVSGTDPAGWYLTSFASASSPEPVRMYRPEAAAYTANLQAANTLFDLSMRDRSGETRYTDPVTGEVRTTSLWMRNLGSNGHASMADRQNRTQTNRYVLQLGGDVIQGSTNGTDALHAGIMGGYGRADSSVSNGLTGRDAKGSVSGYSAGVYGAWYQNAEAKTGVWAETWAQYNWFKNEVSGDMLPVEHYNSQGIKASLEGGYAWLAGRWQSSSGTENSLFLEPHAQAVWSGIRADDHTEAGGTRVQGTGNDGVTTRFGLRTYLNGKSRADQQTVREFQPFVEMNWLHNTAVYGVRMNVETDEVRGSRNVAELKTGVEGRLSRSLTGAVVFTQQAGGSGYRDSRGSLQVSYRF
ncbi:autotransporter outer membrane beta-barrel domain-containing protein [Pantoea ananatis]|jgi:autotransporter family porin|uniref:autotransporter outer membrane beta-barrel domain-containing protein n=1 Tax=Pantoea ananas TaxID=553 RepID=UPI0015770832|nr:autotransporter outer membrane beta-barrel domain-containing protein [Pantoea ananatis]NQE77529.1 autotransporter outer membrane beta-barrel domain-containing protein [Pantoea ananatis]NQE82072.1 autotransporter outer membrane beta-barrel domain-containing protein [Pantoea ananatis]